MLPPVAISSSSTIASLPSTVPDYRVDDDLGIANTLLISCHDRYTQEVADVRRVLGPAEVGRDYDGVGEVSIPEVSGQNVERFQVIDRHAEEPVYLRHMERHCENSVCARRNQQFDRQPTCD